MTFLVYSGKDVITSIIKFDLAGKLQFYYTFADKYREGVVR
jgi:hypothetical protein